MSEVTRLDTYVTPRERRRLQHVDTALLFDIYHCPNCPAPEDGPNSVGKPWEEVKQSPICTTCEKEMLYLGTAEY